MKLADFLDFEVHVPTSWGKAGKECAQSSNVQLRRSGHIEKQFRFKLSGKPTAKQAVMAAKAWAIAHTKLTPHELACVEALRITGPGTE